MLSVSLSSDPSTIAHNDPVNLLEERSDECQFQPDVGLHDTLYNFAFLICSMIVAGRLIGELITIVSFESLLRSFQSLSMRLSHHMMTDTRSECQANVSLD